MKIARLLTRDFAHKVVSGPHELASAARNEPYVYVEILGENVVYLPDATRGVVSWSGSA